MKQLSFWDDCWMWGSEPLVKHPHSDARYFHGVSDTLLRKIIDREWIRTYSLWRRDMIAIKTDENELLEVMALFIEAHQGNYKNVQDYIAVRIGCSQPRVSRLLRMINIDIFLDEMNNYEYINQNMAFISSEAIDSTWKPSEKVIQRKKLSMPRICAGGFEGCTGDSTSGKIPLCLPCHKKASQDYGLMISYPHWLLAEIERIRNEHYKATVDACYEDHHGTMSIDELESYLDAG